MWECCQCGSVASSNVASFQLGIENGSPRTARPTGWGRGDGRESHGLCLMSFVFCPRTEDRRRRTKDLGHWTVAELLSLW